MDLPFLRPSVEERLFPPQKVVYHGRNTGGKVGMEIEGIRIHSIEDLDRVIHQEGIRLGMIAVPASAAQGVANLLAACGIDLAIELEQLSFAVMSRDKKP